MPKYKKQQKQRSSVSTPAQETLKHKLVSLDGMPYGEYIPAPVRQTVEQGLTQCNVAMEKVSAVVSENLPKAKKFYSETVEPAVSPVVALAVEKYEAHPEAVKIAFAAITVFYGGCFPNMAIAYAALGMTNTSAIVKQVRGFNIAGGVGGVLQTQTPESLNELAAKVGVALFVLLAVLRSPLCAALVVGSSLIDLNWDIAEWADPMLQRKIKNIEALGEEKEKWAPTLSQWALKAAAFIMVFFLPAFTTALYVAMLGSRTVAKYLHPRVKIAEKTLAADCALVGAIMQAFWGFTAGYGSLVLTPLLAFESML